MYWKGKYVSPLCYVVSVDPEGEIYLKQLLGEAIVRASSPEQSTIMEALVYMKPRKFINSLGAVYAWMPFLANDWYLDALTEEISKIASSKGKTTYFAIGENLEEAMYHDQYDCQEIVFTYFSYGEQKYMKFWHKPKMINKKAKPVVIHLDKQERIECAME